MNNNAFEVLAEGSEEGELLGMDSFKFTGLVPDAKVSIQEKNFSKSDYPSTVSLLACSGKYGYFIAGHVEGFIFGRTQSLRAAVYATEKGATSTLTEKTIIPLTSPAHQLRLSSDELIILVALMDGSLLSYSVFDLLEHEENAQPKYNINLGTPIIDLRPNTEALPDSACVLLKGHESRIINWKSGETICTIPGNDFSAICWSPKGKQVVCGRLDGTLEHYDLSGTKKNSLSSPESMQAGYGDENINRIVQDVLWIENHQFLVLYARPTEPDSDEFINDGYIIDRKPKTGTGPKYTHLAEVTPIFSPEGRSNHFYMETIRSFGAQFPHVVILANGATNEVSVVGEDDNGNWATWDLPENGMASLPLSEETNCDTFPVGLALDYSASELLPPYDPSESDVGVEPVPVLFHLNDEGHIGSYHCYNEHFASSGTKYQGMKMAITPSPIDTATTPMGQTTSPTLTTAPPSSAFDTKPTSSLSPSAFSSSPFGAALSASSSGTSFASLTKVQGATVPTFGGGQSPGFASLAQNKVSNAVTPTFGSTTSFGAAAGTTFASSSSATPAFGSTTNFGSMAKTDSTPAFGIPSSFGSIDKKTTTPAFGLTTASAGFGTTTEKKQGAPAFGSATGFGDSAKKDDTAWTTLPFGATGFGSGNATEENSNESATPKSGSTSSFEIVTKGDDINQDNNNKETDAGDAENKVDTTDVPSFDSLAIDDHDKQQKDKQEEGKSGEFKKEITYQKGENVSIRCKVDEKNSDTVETDELADDKEGNNESTKPATTTANQKDENTTTKSTPADSDTTSSSTPTSTSFGFGDLAKKTIPGAMNPIFGQATAFGATTSIATATPAPAPAPAPATSGFGFAALSKNTVPGASAPTFGSASTLGGGFPALSKNKVPGASAPAFGSTSTLGGGSPFGSSTTGGFGTLAKNTVPGAKAPAFGSTSTLGGGSSFGTLATKTVPGAVAPAFGSTSGFGNSANNKDGSEYGTMAFGSGNNEKPVTASSATPSPPETTATTTRTTKSTTEATIHPPASSQDASITGMPKTLANAPEPVTQRAPLNYVTPEESHETTKAEPMKEQSPASKKEGMAKQFEALYFKITADLEKLSSLQCDFEKQLQSQSKQLATVNKTVQDLSADLKQWRLGECGQLGNIVDGISNDLMKNDITSGQKEQVVNLELKTSELMNRKNEIGASIATEEDPETRARLAERDLDEATREGCESLELRCKYTGELLGELEYRIINKTKQQQRKHPAQTDINNYSFYDFQCAIRDVERDLKRKDTEMKDLEQKLQLLRFQEHQRVAEYSPSAITFEDLTDDEDPDAMTSQVSPKHDSNLAGAFTEQHIDYTVNYVQAEQVMDKLCTLTSQRLPFVVDANASKK